MKALLIKPRKNPYVVDIDGTLQGIYSAMSCERIECPIAGDGWAMYVDEEGKLNGSVPNRPLYRWSIPDIVFGDFLIVGIDDEGETIDLSDENIDFFMELFGGVEK